MARSLPVVGLCRRLGGAPAALDGVTIVRVDPGGFERGLRSAGIGGFEPSGSEAAIAREARGLLRLIRLAAATVSLWRAARSLGPADVVHANDFETLPAGRLIAGRRARLVYDAHEIYSEFDSDPPRLARRIMLALERRLARRADRVVTVTDAMAEDLVDRLGLSHRPIVVMNCPELDASEPPRPTPRGPLRVVYLAAAGPPRVLADLYGALAAVPDATLTLHVLGADTAALAREVDALGLGERVAILDPVEPDGILEALRSHEVGVVIDRRHALNNELTIPNKLFEYLMAGLAVVVPDVRSMRDLVREHGVGAVFTPGDPQALAKALRGLVDDRDALAAMRRRAYEAARTRFNAESQSVGLDRAWGLNPVPADSGW